MQAVFPQRYVFAIVDPESEKAQNFMLVGHNSPHRIDLATKNLSAFDSPILKGLQQKELKLTGLDLAGVQILTDDYAPVEYLLANLIRQYNEIIRKPH